MSLQLKKRADSIAWLRLAIISGALAIIMYPSSNSFKKVKAHGDPIYGVAYSTGYMIGSIGTLTAILGGISMLGIKMRKEEPN